MLYADRYQLEEKLGSGGMSEVWRARDQLLNRTVAIKIMRQDLVSRQEFVSRFKQEGEIMARIQSPYAVSLFDRGEAEGRPYLAMEYVNGPTLDEWLGQGHSKKQALKMLDGVIQAVSTAHRGGILHRDIKPSNVLIGSDERPQVIDFGVAHDGYQSWDRPGEVIGTAHYISPEQAEGMQAEETSDIYSLGVILYRILAGRLPFQDMAPAAVMAQKVLQDPPRPSRYNKNVSRDEEAVAMWALDRDPERRPQSAEELQAALREASESKQQQRKKPWPWAMALGAIFLAAVAGWFLIYNSATKTVPNVVGLSLAQGQATLDREDIDYLLLFVPGERKNIILRTDPAADKPIEGTVQVYVGAGIKKVTVPELPKRLPLAIRALRRAGLKPIVKKRPGPVARGLVFASSPEAGSRVSYGSRVQVLVSSRKIISPLPDFLGLKKQEAEEVAKSRGLEVTFIYEISSSAAGTVIEQSPDAGSRAQEVVLTLAKQSEDLVLTVPDTLGLEEGAAVRLLEDSGFSVSVQTEETANEEEAGTVLRQSPSSGELLGEGEVVEIFIGLFEPTGIEP